MIKSVHVVPVKTVLAKNIKYHTVEQFTNSRKGQNP